MEAVVHLDTHVVVWLFAGELERFPKFVRHELERNELAVSPAVILELEYLHEIGRLSERAVVVASDLAARIGLRVDEAPFSAIVATALELSSTRDPFDRLIVSHARTRDASLITADKTIHKHFASLSGPRNADRPVSSARAERALDIGYRPPRLWT